ncbi:flotillin family protein [Patescibacteria group bacterium]
MSMTLILLIAGACIVFGTFIAALTRYKKCKSNELLVVYGKTGSKKEGSVAKCIHGGGTFVWPVIQDHGVIPMTPIQIDIPLRGALTKQMIKVNLPASFMVGVSAKDGVMNNAAERLLGLNQTQTKSLAEDIIFGALRVVVATMSIEEINSNRDEFIRRVTEVVDVELNKVGLESMNVNTKDIEDESGYIEALGKKAASEAINKAKVDVAENDRDGATGAANAQQMERVNVAGADAKAVEGENEAKVTIANSNASRREQTAEAERKGTAAENVKHAEALQESYGAEKSAEEARAKKEAATQQANVIVPAEIAKQKAEIDADAEAEKLRREAKGRGDATYEEMSGQARGTLEILTKQAEGLKQIVEAAGGDPKNAAMLMVIDKLPELTRIQVDAIKNLKIDKITVWDNNGGGNGDGKSSTANFLSGIMGAVPPLNELFQQAGMNLPEFLGAPVPEGFSEENTSVEA